MAETAVITGLGVAAPNGLGTEPFWAATRAGTGGIAEARSFDPADYPCRLAGEVPGFAAEHHLPNRLLPQTDRVTRLALAAAEWALTDAKIVPEDLPGYDMGVITASSSGGFHFSEHELRALWSQGSRYVSAYQSFAWFYAVNSGQISIRHGMKGPSGVVVSDQAGGLDAVAQARRQIRRGTPVIVTGGMDASVCSWGWVFLMATEQLTRRDRPEEAYLPFDRRADGHVPGEGGAILIMEAAAAARARGARIYGEVAGYGATFDPAPGRDRDPGLPRAIELALGDAGVAAAEVDAVFADGAAVPELDRREADALVAVFGPHGVPVTLPKTMTGRLYSGAGPLDIAAALLAMTDGLIPPSINIVPDPAYRLDLVVDHPRVSRPRVVLVLARGRGGFNSAVVLRRP